jgi:hypothetical protein
MTTISAQEARTLLSKPKRSKYGAKKTELDGVTYDSKAEADYAAELKLREKAGEVGGIEIQRPFPILINGFSVGVYRADFSFIDHKEGGRLRVIDVKGYDTPLSKFKRKCVEAFYRVKIEVVK